MPRLPLRPSSVTKQVAQSSRCTGSPTAISPGSRRPLGWTNTTCSAAIHTGSGMAVISAPRSLGALRRGVGRACRDHAVDLRGVVRVLALTHDVLEVALHLRRVHTQLLDARSLALVRR